MTHPVLDEQRTAWQLRAAWLACKPVRLTLTDRCVVPTIVGRITAVSVTGAFCTIDGWHVPTVDIRGIGKPTLEDAHNYGALMRELRQESVGGLL